MELQNYFEDTEKVRLEGQHALITGASAGIGLATACLLAKEGCHLTLVARRESRLRDIQAELGRLAPQSKVRILPSDVRSMDLFETLSQDTFDIFINNAGLAKGVDSVADGQMDDWQQMISVNIEAAFRLTKAVVVKMRQRQQGHILMVASVAGHHSYEGGSVYCATKHALRAFTAAMRQELCNANVRVSTVSPGLVETEFSDVRFSGDRSRAKDVYRGMTPLSGKDIAQQILWQLKQPNHVNVDEIYVTPTAQGGIGKVHRDVSTAEKDGFD